MFTRSQMMRDIFLRKDRRLLGVEDVDIFSQVFPSFFVGSGESVQLVVCIVRFEGMMSYSVTPKTRYLNSFLAGFLAEFLAVFD